MATKTKTYKCKSNDNKIKIICSNGDIDELWFKAEGDKGWVVIGIEDLNKALKTGDDKTGKAK